MSSQWIQKPHRQAPAPRVATSAPKQSSAHVHPRVGARKIVGLVEATARKRRKKVIMDVLNEFEEVGRAKGKLEGRVEGRVDGRARTLLEQLNARFGPVPPEAKARIHAANEATLARWSLAVLTAPTLAAVLESKVKKAAAPPRPAARKRTRAA